jgi:hypothetical protein
LKCAALNEEDVLAMLAMAFPIPAGKTETVEEDVVQTAGERDPRYGAQRASAPTHAAASD